MLLFYVRHGDPIYNPDSLTPLGKRQAEAAAKRLSIYGIDKIFASTSTRAIQTSAPTCEIMKKDVQLLDFCNESHAWEELTVENDIGKTWLFSDNATRRLFTEDSIRQLGFHWYNHPDLAEHNYKKGIDRIYNETDKFLLSLGYEHERYTGRYKSVNPTNDRIALFAHQGFFIAFLSCVLDIPYPQIGLHFDCCHTGITTIEFNDVNGCTIPKVLTLSSDSHIYKEGLPTNYNNHIRF